MRRNCPISVPAAGPRRCPLRIGPRHAGIDLGADPQAAHAKPPHDCARRLAARDDDAAHAARDQALGDRAPAPLRSTRRPASRPSRACSAATLSGGAEAAITTGVSPSLSGRPIQRRRAQCRGIRRGQRRRVPHRQMRRARYQAAPASRASMIRRAPRRRPSTRGSAPGIDRAGSNPARRKFSGRPIATPEPPVISACYAAASPIASRCASVTASTIA